MSETEACGVPTGRGVEVGRAGGGAGRPRAVRGLGAACWAYLATTLAVWLAYQIGEERWWPVTILLYAPRWPWALPLAVLAPASAAFRPRGLAPLTLAAGVLLGPILGLCIPRASSPGGTPDAPAFRIMTLNTEGEHLDLDAFRELIARTWPDVVVLQEWSGRDASAAFPGEGWAVRESHGLCLASRLPVLRDEALDPAILGYLGRAARYEILVQGRVVRVADVHLPTPRVGLQAILDDRRGGVETLREGTRRRRWMSDLVSRWVSGTSEPLIVAGDFNLPADASIFRASWSGLADAFAGAGFGFGPTKFTRWHGVRIDHILMGPGWRPRRCWVGPDVGSDHRPVLADLEFGPGSWSRPESRPMVPSEASVVPGVAPQLIEAGRVAIMKILAMTNLYPNPLNPHRATFNRQELRSLAARHEVSVIAPIAWTDEVRAARGGASLEGARRRVDAGGIAVEHPRHVFPPRTLRSWYGAFYRWSVRPAFERALARARPDLVYGPWAYPDGWAAVRLARGAGLPVVLKVHGSDIRLVDRHPGRLRGTRQALAEADAVVAVSRDLAERVVALGADPARVRLIYGGINPELFAPGPREEARLRLGLRPDGPVLLFVGNLVPVKGVDVLIAAVARLVGGGMRPTCYLIGQGPLGPRLDRLALRLGVGDRVRRLGPRPLERLADWYRAADLFVLPSHSEGVPSVLTEAVACGTPYVASRVGGVPEIAHLGRGRLVPPGDADALARAIGEAVADPAPPGATAPAPRTYDDMAGDLTALFEGVVGRPAPLCAGGLR